MPPRGGAGAKTSSSSSSGGGGSSSGDFGGESGSPSAVKGKGKGRGEVPDAAQNGGVLPGDEVQPPAIGTPVAGTPVGGTADALGLEQAAETPTATVAIVAATPEPQAGQGDQGDDEELEVWAPPHSELAKEEASEVQEEEDYVSVADLLASANRQAKVFAQAPGTGGGGKRGDPAALAFVSKVCVRWRMNQEYCLMKMLKKSRVATSNDSHSSVLIDTWTGEYTCSRVFFFCENGRGKSRRDVVARVLSSAVR